MLARKIHSLRSFSLLADINLKFKRYFADDINVVVRKYIAKIKAIENVLNSSRLHFISNGTKLVYGKVEAHKKIHLRKIHSLAFFKVETHKYPKNCLICVQILKLQQKKLYTFRPYHKPVLLTHSPLN